ncbi:8497_t:CDS:2 [Diversispora eburnea]|uniref:8497_t:CDS:1 n=1 Tax=Diversispora eburnea TaxID=1213867 RepID=A0A9N8WCN8_9GLOM|nr:8497_t:CDS:2 [Diversispora eburnea]
MITKDEIMDEIKDEMKEEDKKFISFLVGEEYERERSERIQQNMALLAKLGLDQESLKQLKPQKQKIKKELQSPTTEETPSPSRHLPTRRSKRIQQLAPRYDLRVKNGTASRYRTYTRKRKYQSKKNSTGRNNQGRRIYGGRIYDSELGTTCHQCRQKTVEDKVQCTNALADGSLCKVMMDERCLIGRYGETLEEARESGEWSCPKCRGVCNCSFCRRKKGLPATGILKYHALANGYNSVMDYLGDNKKIKRRS